MFFVHNYSYLLHNTNVKINCLLRCCNVDRIQRFLVIASYIMNTFVIKMALKKRFLSNRIIFNQSLLYYKDYVIERMWSLIVRQ